MNFLQTLCIFGAMACSIWLSKYLSNIEMLVVFVFSCFGVVFGLAEKK